MLKQDDPKKCTATKLVKFGLATNIKKTTSKTLVLDPFSKKTILPSDSNLCKSITGIDCSWNLATQTFSKNFLGVKRKLPPLLAGNPVNYSKLGKLTTVRCAPRPEQAAEMDYDSFRLPKSSRIPVTRLVRLRCRFQLFLMRFQTRLLSWLHPSL